MNIKKIVNDIEAFWYYFVIKSPQTDQTPILDMLEERKINILELKDFIDKYGELILWMFDAINIQKQRIKDFPKLSNGQAFYEGMSTPTDLFRMIEEEFERRSKNAAAKREFERMKKRYGRK